MTEDFQSRNDQSKKEHKKRKVEMQRKEGNEAPAFIRFFSDRRTHIILGIILILFAFFTLVTTINYFKTGERDQSQIINNEISQIVQNGNEIDNVGGAFGAYLSDLMMSEWLGFGAFILVLYLGIIGYSLIRKRKCGFWSLTFKSLILAITISIVIGLVTFNNEGFLYWGGKHGHFINQFFISHTGMEAPAGSIRAVCPCRLWASPAVRSPTSRLPAATLRQHWELGKVGQQRAFKAAEAGMTPDIWQATQLLPCDLDIPSVTLNVP